MVDSWSGVLSWVSGFEFGSGGVEQVECGFWSSVPPHDLVAEFEINL